jgi:two-component system chemotaxis response regulator CheB
LAAIRVALAADEAHLRLSLSAALAEHDGLQLVGTAASIAELQEMAGQADVIVLPLELNKTYTNVLQRQLKAVHNVPFILLADASQYTMLITGLQRGAHHWLPLPGRETPIAGSTYIFRLAERLQAAARGAVKSLSPPEQLKGVVVAAGSSGAIEAAEKTFALLPANYPLPIIWAQHLPKGYLNPLVERLRHQLKLPVNVAVDGEYMLQGLYLTEAENVYLTANLHGYLLKYTQQMHQGHNFPSADMLLKSAANLQTKITCLVFSGMGADGAGGVADIATAGGNVLVQSAETSLINGMPAAAIQAVPAASVGSPEQLAERLLAIAELDY